MMKYYISTLNDINYIRYLENKANGLPKAGFNDPNINDYPIGWTIDYNTIYIVSDGYAYNISSDYVDSNILNSSEKKDIKAAYDAMIDYEIVDPPRVS